MKTDYFEQGLEQNDIEQIRKTLDRLGKVRLYERSINKKGEVLFFMIREKMEINLIIIPNGDTTLAADFNGKLTDDERLSFIKCRLTGDNADALRKHFDFTNPRLIGKTDSYGFGDRLGSK